MSSNAFVAERPRVGLDNAVFAGRLRPPVERQPAPLPKRSVIMDGGLQKSHAIETEQPVAEKAEIIMPQPAAFIETEPAHDPAAYDQPAEPEEAEANFSNFDMEPIEPEQYSNPFSDVSLTHKVMLGIASLVFIVGVVTSLQTIKSNRTATAQINEISRQIELAK